MDTKRTWTLSIDGDDVRSIIDENGQPIADHITSEEVGNYMAAAPDLIEALRILSSEAKTLASGYDYPESEVAPSIVIADRIIEKTIGHAPMSEPIPQTTPQYEINNEIVFSTCHITKEENDLLDAAPDDDRLPFVSIPYEYGYMVYTGYNGDNQLDKFDGLPNVLKLVHIAIDHKCKWLVFDRDASEVNGLEKFDW